MRTLDTKAVDDASKSGFYKRSTSTNNIPQFFKNMTMGWAGSGQLADPDGNQMPPSSPVGTSSISMGLKRISSSNTMSTSLSAKGGGGGGVVAKYNGGLHVQTKDSRALESKKQAASRPIVLPKPGTLFHWGGEHIMDQKGLISFLATSGGTVSWQNPADTGVIKIDSSPWSKGRVQEVRPGNKPKISTPLLFSSVANSVRCTCNSSYLDIPRCEDRRGFSRTSSTWFRID